MKKTSFFCDSGEFPPELENFIFKLLLNKDIDCCYRALISLACVYYHMIGNNSFLTQDDYFKSFPFSLGSTVDFSIIKSLLDTFDDSDESLWKHCSSFYKID